MKEEPDAVTEEEVGAGTQNDHIEQGLRVSLVELAFKIEAT